MIYGIIKLKQDKLSVIADLDWRRKNETIRFSNEILKKTDNLLAEINKKFHGEIITIIAWKQLENIVHWRRQILNQESLYEEFEEVVGKLNDWRKKPPIETRGNYNPLKWRMFFWGWHNAEK